MQNPFKSTRRGIADRIGFSFVFLFSPFISFFCCIFSLVCGYRHLVYKARVQLTRTRIPSSYPCLPHPNMVLSNAPIPPLPCLCTTPKKESVDSIVQYVVSSWQDFYAYAWSIWSPSPVHKQTEKTHKKDTQTHTHTMYFVTFVQIFFSPFLVFSLET